MKKTNFTLVELLIVIAIIILLAGMILPAVSSSLKKADQTKAKAEITTLLNAIRQFEATYGYIPRINSSGNDQVDNFSGNSYRDLILVLQGQKPENDTFGASKKNPNKKNTRFMDIQGNKPGTYQDPWGNDYIVITDRNNSSTISSNVEGVIDTKIYQSIVIYSRGEKTGSTAKDFKDNIYSFPVEWDKTSGKYKIGR